MNKIGAKVAPDVRVASPADAAVLAEVGRRTFDDAFRENVAPDDMVAYLAQAFAPTQVAAELADPDALFLLANLGDEAVGYAKLYFGPPHESVAGAAWQPAVKLWRLYADARWYGRGIGAALMRECFHAARERGGRSLWLTTNIHNRRAISFYERWGFQIVGETTFTLGSAVHEDYVFARLLPNSREETTLRA